MGTGSILLVMAGLFLLFGYLGVPVAFAIMGGGLAATGEAGRTPQNVGQIKE